MSKSIETWDDLAVALNVPIRELYRERKKPAAPQSLDLEAWVEYYEGKASLDVGGLTPTSYDAGLKAGQLVLDDALSHSRLVEQEIINERRREELKRVRGDVITKDKAEEKVRAITAAALEALALLPDIVAAATPPGERPEMRRRAKEWVDQIRTAMAERLRA